MEDRILALLKAKFSGEREDGLKLLAAAIALQVNTDEDVTKAVEGITEDKVKTYIQNWRKNADLEITKSNQTYKAGLEKQFDITPKKKEETPPNPKDDNQTDAIAKLLEKHLAPITERLASIEKGETTKSRQTALTEALKDANPAFRELAVKSFSGMSFGSEDDFAAYVETIKKDSDAFTQQLREQGLKSFTPPYKGGDPTNNLASQAECDAIASGIS